MVGTGVFGATRRILFTGLAVVVAASFVVLMTASPAEAAPNVFTVDRSDDPDLSADPVADNCTAGVADDCSLRGAIAKANKTADNAAGPDEIRFNIPGAGPHTISPTSSLPGITGPVTIDGYREPDSAPANSASKAVLKIELSGANAADQFATGLHLDAGANGTTIKGLVINRWSGFGVVVDARNAAIEGNFIGTNTAGDAALGNGVAGVRVRSSGNLIGGTGIEARNIVSGNNDDGIVISGSNATGNRIEGNRIGTDATGTSALGNEQGVNITEASGNFVGGPGAGNLISGNTGRGVLIAGNTSKNNAVRSNFVGLKANGTGTLSNGAEGVEIFEGSNNVIGGTLSNQGNIISGNDAAGVELAPGAKGNRVQGNLVGTGQNGASDFGNGGAGVLVQGPNNLVGGTASLARNVISGNGGSGVSIIGASGNTVQGNRIGTSVNGTGDFGNDFDGVAISGSSSNTIGGTAAGAANTIAFNDHGVEVDGFGSGAIRNRISANSIHSNGLLGINLVGGEGTNGDVTENDPKDPDAGNNLLQNFPEITSTSTTQIRGTLDSRPGKTFKIQLFSNPAANIPTGFGEGQTFLGEKTVTTNKQGKASFTFNVAVPAGQVVAATATDAGGNTSEFSRAVTVQQ